MKKYLVFIVIFGLSNFTFGQKFISSDPWERKAQKKVYNETLEKAQNGDLESQFYMGNLYSNGQVLEPDYDQARYWYKKACDKGYAKAFIPLGNLYEEDFKNNINFSNLEKAVKYKDKKALTEIETSVRNIEDLYVKGISLVSDGTDKNQMFDKLLSFLDFRVGALDNLDNIYVENDNSRALELCKLASELGSSKAANVLALHYCIQKDFEKATKCFLISADKGYPSAQRDIGLMYYKGDEIPQNLNESFKYLRMFALNPSYTYETDEEDDDWKDGTILHYLATCYRYGKGTPINTEIADLWDALAAVYDSNDADDYICELAKKDMDDDELGQYVLGLFTSFIKKHNIKSKSSKIITAMYYSGTKRPLECKQASEIYLSLEQNSELSELDKFHIYQSLSIYYRAQNNMVGANNYKNKLMEMKVKTQNISSIRVGDSDVDFLIPEGLEKWFQDLYVDILKKY